MISSFAPVPDRSLLYRGSKRLIPQASAVVAAVCEVVVVARAAEQQLSLATLGGARPSFSFDEHCRLLNPRPNRGPE